MKQFLAFLTDDQGRSLTLENEVVVTRSLPDPLEHSPEGWEKSVIQFARNNEFRGMVKSYTTSLKFYLEGAKILRDAFYRKGMEAVIYLIWLKLDQSFGGGMKYNGWYKGECDFGTFKDGYDGVSCNVSEGGFFKDLQANKAVIQEIPFEDNAVKLFMDGMIIDQALHFEIQDAFALSNTGLIISIYADEFIYMPLTFLNNEGNSSGVTFFSQTGKDTSTPDYNSQKFFLATSSDLQPHFKFNIKFTVSGHAELMNIDCYVKMRFFLHTQGRQYDLTGPTTYTVATADPFGNIDPNLIFGTISLDLPFEFDFPLNAGENVFFMAELISANLRGAITFNQSDFVVNYSTRATPTTIDAYRVFDLGNKLTSKVSKGSFLSSPLLEPDVNLLVTSGDAIRSLPNAVIKTSLSDWHKSVDAVKCSSLDIVNNNPVVKSRYDDFNKISSIANLGECSNWTLDSADDYIYDSVQIGYPSKGTNSINDINGKYSFNNTFTWSINITRRKVNVYDAKSVYFADPFDIELIRLNLDGKDTTTANTDNSNFFIDAELKQDFYFTGATHFSPSDNTIQITGDISPVQQFLTKGMRYNIFGSVNNNGVYTIDEVINLVPGTSAVLKIKELVASLEDSTTTLVAVNLYRLRRLPYATINGIPNPATIFNIEISPRRILANHFRWLRSSFDHLDANKLIFKTTDKNADLETIDADGKVINERADIPVSSMGEKVYLPYYTSFEIKSPENLLELMTANSTGKFDYTMNGVAMDGFPIQISTEDTHLETQTYKLLQTANCNNLLLINNR